MKLTADFTDDLKPEELEELVLMSRDEGVTPDRLILRGVRMLQSTRRAERAVNQEQPQAA